MKLKIMSAKGGSASGGKKIIVLIVVAVVLFMAVAVLYFNYIGRCKTDADCKIIYSPCGCMATPIYDSREKLEYDPIVSYDELYLNRTEISYAELDCKPNFIPKFDLNCEAVCIKGECLLSLPCREE